MRMSKVVYNCAMYETNPISVSRKVRADSVRNHELILCTARRLFDEHGVATVTMSAVADAADIGKGTLYRHFPDKAELLFALVEHEAELFREQVTERTKIDETPRDTLHWFVDQALSFALRNSGLLCEATNHAPNASLGHPTRLWWREVLHGLFTRAGAATDPCYAADTIYMMLDAQTLYFQQQSLGYDVTSLSTNLHALVDSVLG
jgi:AcrR family transcriptional regulator